MSLLKVSNLCHGFGDKVLYDKGEFELYKGEHIGIVGQNGVGKSTLINVLVGKKIVDKGDIAWQNKIKIGHLDQHAEIDLKYTVFEYLKTAFEDLFKIEDKMNKLYEEQSEESILKASEYQDILLSNDFYSIDNEIKKISNGLGINAIGLDKNIGQLSGGQRAKVILAKLLLINPEVLLLDEPTNFLDKEHIDWLSEYLSSFEGSFIIISHDFDFLEKVCNCILHIEFSKIKKYYGKYSDFVKQKEHLRENYIRQYTAQQKKIEKEEDYIRRNIAGVNSRIAKGRRKRLDRMEKIDAPKFNKKPNINFKEVNLPNQKALVVKDLEVGYKNALLPKLSFVVKGGENLVITGFNGIGKSTLLKTLTGIIKPISGEFQFNEKVKLCYYEQDLNWENPNMTPCEILSDKYPDLDEKIIKSMLSASGVSDQHLFQPISTLSGGEQSKVKICILTALPYNFLILDEPTNHFDVETKEELLRALKNFKGSIILVSHEEIFYKQIADKYLKIEDFLKKEGNNEL